jgi:hypothetical protein
MCSPPGIFILGGFLKTEKTNLNSLSWTESFRKKDGQPSA